MNIQGVRAGNTQSKQNEGAFALVVLEIMMVAAAIGVFNSSWVWGGGIIFLAMFVMSTSHARKALLPLAAITWGYIGYAIGGLFVSTNAAAGIGVLFAAISFELHLQALGEIVGLRHEDDDNSDPDLSPSRPKLKARNGTSSEEANLRDVFTKNAPLTGSADKGFGRYISASIFVFGLSTMLFWWWYEPDPTRGFDGRSTQTWSRLNETDRKVYQILPEKLRLHVNGLDERDQAWYVQEWDQRRKKTCTFGAAKTERFDKYYGLRRCLSKDGRDTIDFAIDHVFSRKRHTNY